MCGFVSLINCFTSLDERKKIFFELKKINSHRGPDKIIDYHKNNLSVLFRRLKIIDLTEKSNQPFFNENKKIFTIFNGEIYNYIELKKELENKKIHFQTSSDTEVIIKLYEMYGIEFVTKLRGMFSILIFDTNLNKTFFFRDRLGQKPLHYSNYKKGIIFSSEIKDIIYIKNKQRLIENSETVTEYLLRGWRDKSDRTFFKDIYQIPPACYGELDGSNLKIKKYWELDCNGRKNFNEDEFIDKFNENLKIHLRSDVPVAFALSGGVDSSSLIKNSIKFQRNNIQAYSLLSNYSNDDDERKIVEKFVKENNIFHEFYNIHDNISNDILEDIIQKVEGPLNYTNHIYQYLLRKKIKQDGYKVLITGEGGDEVLGGYNRFIIPYLYYNYYKLKKNISNVIIKNLDKNPGSFKSIFQSVKNFSKISNERNDIENKKIFSFLSMKEKKIPKDVCFIDTSNKRNNSFKQFLKYFLINNDVQSILQQEDRISMSQSIESRVPFLDHKFIEYIFSIKDIFFIKDGITKFMLKKSFNKSYPNEFKMNVPKVAKPGAPNNIVFELYYDKFCDLLLSPKYKNEYFSNSDVLKKLKYAKDNKTMNYKDFSLFRILNYLIWKENNQNHNRI